MNNEVVKFKKSKVMEEVEGRKEGGRGRKIGDGRGIGGDVVYKGNNMIRS
ncbi:hypothetical protein [Paenibacillus xylanexedens]|nr:hypothetical protein [Paenibacillus xylanexedens]